MFKRKIYSKLLDWKRKSQGKTALLIEGARRVGKSTVVEHFARNEYKSFILIDFSIAPKHIVDLFDDISDLNYLFLQLQLTYKTTLYIRESLIVFDEVQFCPKARQAIKHLVKDHRYDYIETGSLISIKKNTHAILIPSEERRITMFPMDFEEFLWATGDETTYDLLKDCYERSIALGQSTNRMMMRRFRLYMLIGGMPQAVDEYIKTNNLQMVDAVKRDILSLYEEDLYKLDQSGKASMLFKAIPAQLNSNSSRFQISSILKNDRYSTLSETISEMENSHTILISHHVNDPNTGLSNNMSLSRFKIYASDTGLFVTLMFKDKEFTENSIYEKLLNDKLSSNLGYLYENVVAQMLRAKGEELFYYTFPNELSTHNFELDFIISRDNKICPLEVKSSGYKSHKSLDVFSSKYSNRIARKYLITTKDLSKDQDIICLPFYMVPFI